MTSVRYERCSILFFCTKSAPNILNHVLLLLALFNGAGLAAFARLRLDPTIYLILEFALPSEYRAMCVLLAFNSITSVTITHMVLLASTLRQTNQTYRRGMFFTFAALMSIIVLLEIGIGTWICISVQNYIDSMIKSIESLIPDSIKTFKSVVDSFLGYDVIEYTINQLFGAGDIINKNKAAIIGCVATVPTLQVLSILLAVNAAYSDTKPQFPVRSRCMGPTTVCISSERNISLSNKNWNKRAR